MPTVTRTSRTRVRRVPKRGIYDRAVINQVLDAGVLCHVGYVIDGAPYVTPTLYWREDDRVYWHGSSASRMLRKVIGAEVCLTVSHLDGFVLARSGFHHSVNYRSVMLFGVAELVSDVAEKRVRLDRFIDSLFPGRADAIRRTTDQELKATKLLSMPIDEVSAKIRTGGPVDDEEDYALPIWAGVVPVSTTLGAPDDDGRVLAGVEIPDHVAGFIAGYGRRVAGEG